MAGNQNAGNGGGVIHTPAGNPASPAQPSSNPTPPMNTSPVPSAATAPVGQASASSPLSSAPQAQPDFTAGRPQWPGFGEQNSQGWTPWQGFGGQGMPPPQGGGLWDRFRQHNQQAWNPWQGFGGHRDFDFGFLQQLFSGFGPRGGASMGDNRRDSIDAPPQAPATPMTSSSPFGSQGGLGALVNPNRDEFR